jgi:hypothetical protein
MLSEPATYEDGLRSLTLLASSGAIKAGVGKGLPGLAPWKAAGGRVWLAPVSAEDLLDEAESLKESGGWPGVVPLLGIRSPFAARAGAIPAAGAGVPGAGAGGRDLDRGRDGGGPLARAWGWAREEFTPFIGPHFLAANLAPAGLALAATMWLTMASGVFAGDSARWLASDSGGAMHLLTGGLGAVALPAFLARWLRGPHRHEILAGVGLGAVSFMFLPRTYAAYCVRTWVVYFLALYFCNRLRHLLHKRASSAPG